MMTSRRGASLGFAAVCVSLLSTSASAQSTGWTTATVNRGKITVTWRVSARTNERGEEVPLIEYLASSTAPMTLQQAIDLMRDASRHHEFMGDKTSERVEVISDSEWVMHSRYAAPWPFPDNDRVTRMTVVEDADKKNVTYTFLAAPSAYKETGVKRVTWYQQVYTFKDVGDGKVEFLLETKMSPPNPAPLWMIRAAFPGAGADPLRKFIELAGQAK
jgi:hypothetical protein